MKTPSETISQTRRLSTTLTTAFFSLSLVALLLLSTVETYSDFKTQEAFISSKQRFIALNAAKTVSNFIQESFGILETAIWLADPDGMPGPEQRRMLRSLLGLQPAFRHLLLFDPNNQIVAQATRSSLASARQSANQLKDAFSGPLPTAGRVVSPVYIDPKTSEPLVILAVPVTNVFGDFKGRLFAELNLKSMFDIVDQCQVGQSGYAFVSDRKGNLIAFYDTARVLKGENVAQLKAVADFMATRTGGLPPEAIRYKGILGTTVVGTYVPLKTPDWAVVVELPWQEAYREIFLEIKTAAGITLAVAILAGIFGFLMARRLAAPVINLTRTATRIADGERELLATVGIGGREIVHLAIAFNSMTAQLRQSLKDVEIRFVDLKRTEAALRLSEERLRMALEGTTDGIWDWNLESGQVYFSPRYYTMMGYEPEEFPAAYESWLQRIHPEDAPAAEKAVGNAIKSQTPFAIEFRFRSKSGQWRWILSRGKVTESHPDGTAVRMAGSHTDISDRKQAIDSLHKYKRIVDTSQDMMALISRDHVYEAVNKSVLTAHRLPREKIVGRAMPDLMGQQHFREKFQARIDEALTGKTVHYQESAHLAGRGRRILAISHFPYFNNKGIVEGVVLNARDITETRKLEEQLMQSQKIESIGTLAGGVAHEINNPINGIMNYAELILDQLPEKDPARTYVQEILHETRRIARIVKNLLTFARQDQQTQSPARLSNIVSAVLSLIQMVMRHDRITLEVDIPEDLPQIRCRSQQIQQVLMNLITNARDALNERYPDYSPGKKLRVSAKIVQKQGRRFIRTTVEDFGSGIPPAILDRVFDPFFTTKPKETGTGLGLSISYGILRDHGGELSVESKPGRATRFYMDLPVGTGRDTMNLHRGAA